ncbi:hypothetical protein WJX72_002791 [[Myrmecia] bisecta]|uniref:Uncharacterized protein n=1 Tax=[Myrmecia] bisecta TaxID=41462 RepID=A0AAW1PJI1_9CHLO
MTDVPADQGNKPAAVAPSQEPPNQEPDKSDDKSTAAIAVPASAPLVTPPPQPAKTFFEGSPPPLGSSTAKHAYTRDFLLSFRSRFTKPPANWDSDSFRELHESSFFDRDRGGGVLHNGGLGPNKPLQMFAPGATGKGDTGWRTGAGGFRPPMQALPAQIGPIRSRLVEDGTLGSSPGPQASSLPDRPVPRGPGEAGDKGWGARDRWRPNGNAEPVSPRRAARVPGEPERWHSGKLEGEGGPPPGMPIRPAWDPKGAVPKDGKDREPGWQKRETTPHKDFEAERQRMKEQSRQAGHTDKSAAQELAAVLEELLAQKLAQQQQQQQQAPPDPYAAFAGRQPGMGGGANGLAHPSLQQQQQFRQPQASLGYGGGPLAYPQAGYAGLAGPPANAGYQNPALGQYGVRPQPALSMQSQGSALDNFFDAPR